MHSEPNVAIPAADFWKLITKPCISDFLADAQDFRKTVLAVWALSALVEHICWENFTDQMSLDDSKFLRNLQEQVPAYAVIQEASNCLKHAVRKRGKPKAAGSASINIRARGWGEAEYGIDEWGGTPAPLVDYINGNSASINHAIQTIEDWIQEQLKIK
jgi:hypothetical protein